jgi:hypothetical protein
MQEKRKDLVWIMGISLTIALILAGYFLAMTVVIPVSNYKIEIPEEKPGDSKLFRPDPVWQSTVGDSIKNKAIDLISSESFLLSKLELTTSDSINMAISLKDSSVMLVVQGVTIYSAKIQSYSFSHYFSKINPFDLALWLSKPFVIDSHYSSIPKVPMLYKKAPKDTIEAMSQLELDPLKDDLDPIEFQLNLDRKLNLVFMQAELPEKGTMKQLKIYHRSMRAIARKDIFDHLSKFKPIEFVPEINIVIDKKAARVIYRAIPVNASVSIRLQAN